MAECSIADHLLRHRKHGAVAGTYPNSLGFAAARGRAGTGTIMSGVNGAGPGGFTSSSTTPRATSASAADVAGEDKHRGVTAGTGGGGRGFASRWGNDDIGGSRGRGPIPWCTVGKGQHRRVLLPTNYAGGGVNCVSGGSGGGGGGSGGGAPAGSSSAIPQLDGDDAVEMNGSAGGREGGRKGLGNGPGVGKGGRWTAVGAAGGGCSLAHASRCLHNVMYLCAARGQVNRGG